MPNTTVNPWYREPWPWLILGILGLGVCSGLGILIIGLKHPPDVIRGEYAQLGKALVATTGPGMPATGQTGELFIDGEDVVVELSAANPTVLSEANPTAADYLPRADQPDTLLLHFPQPETGGITAVLRWEAAGRYRGVLPAAPPTRARVTVTDPEQTWRLDGRLSTARRATLSAHPQ